jgi:hypothetical protein
MLFMLHKKAMRKGFTGERKKFKTYEGLRALQLESPN